MKLVRLIYASRLLESTNPNQIARIHERALVTNPEHGISGILIFGNDSFLQYLEGSAENVNQLFQNISRDKRHADICLLEYTPIEKREFQDWAMKLVLITPKNIAEMSSLLPKHDFYPFEMNPEQAIQLCKYLKGKKRGSSLRAAS